jgi:FlaA1/EpsC-like NDP-sugar epimerase
MLDVLGPLVVHEDGTTGRIANWHEMTSAEQANVVRVLGRRNKKRLERLRSQAQEKPSGAGAICVVTGASGFIASMLVKQLCERGFMVRGTVRSLGDRAKVEHLYGLCPAERLTLHEADLLSDGSFESAIDGADIVFHTASPFFMGGFSDAQAELIEPAVNGTRNVISSAIAAGVKRIVLTSSMAAIAECARPIICCAG